MLPIQSKLLLSPPTKPHKPNHEFNPSRNPQRRLHPPCTPTQPPSRNRPDKQHDHSTGATIPLNIPGRPRDQLRITRQIKVHTRQHHRGDLVIPQRPRRRDTPRALERQERNRDQFQEQRSTGQTGVLRGMRDKVCFDQGDGDDDEDGLHQEGDEEGSATTGAGKTRGVGEHGCAEEEGGDGDEGFQPAPRFVEGLGGGA